MTVVPTIDQVRALLPANKHPEDWQQAMAEILPKYSVDTVDRIAAFLAQTGYESNDFTHLEENLNYSAKRLEEVFGSRFTGTEAQAYANKPQQIANRVYSN